MQRVYEGRRKLRNGATSVTVSFRPRPVHRIVTPNAIAAVEALLKEYRCIKVDDIAIRMEVGEGSAHHIVRDVLQSNKVSNKGWEPVL